MKLAINGFGRIGRQALRVLLAKNSPLEIVAINDLATAAELAHLFTFDSTYGRYPGTVAVEGDALVVDDRRIVVTAERDPAQLPWRQLGVDVVIESTGFFTERAGAAKHLTAGAKRVLISAPAKGADLTLVRGVNDHAYDPALHHIVSNASCTTNCLAPIAAVLQREYGIVQGLMTTTHAYTGDQNLLDGPHRDLRRARAAALSIVPTTTGAAAAVAEVLPELRGKLTGIALRVPTPTVSAVDLVVELAREATAAELNATFAAAADELTGILGVEDRPLVSSDYRGDSRSAIVDTALTTVMGGRLAKIVAWYDNEWGYSCRLVEVAELLAR